MNKRTVSLNIVYIILGLMFIGTHNTYGLEPVIERGANANIQDIKNNGEQLKPSSIYTLGKNGNYTNLSSTRVGYKYTIWTNWRHEDALKVLFTTISPLPNGEAADYIERHKGRINIKEVYPKGSNPLKMPQLEIWGSKERPTSITAVKEFIFPMLADDVIAKLSESGKLRGDNLLETVEFSPVQFVKYKWKSEGKEIYRVEKWWPSSLILEEFVESSKKESAQEMEYKTDEPAREMLTKELMSLLPHMNPVTPERSEFIWRNLKLCIKKILDQSCRSYGLPNVFFQELKGDCDMVSAKTPYKVFGDELKIADGAIVQFKSGERFFFLEGTWRNIAKQTTQVDSCLKKIRELGKKEVHEYKVPPRVSFIEGALE